ncbi:hypothetical protein B9Z19DRAFT_991026 [Tuber borchii]|uniref:Structure-specific endonuclease subunit SLX4 n=1 Tax=Tuber borchii TaxID=42251 RepID=A0A2T6ZLK7_TUBBO|nr:hypothetical protein B9Z19DRAFT_991026 [Tuber borchii]
MARLNTRTDPIILLSSPPVPSLRIATTNTDTTISSPPSSPLLSPSALLQELVEKGAAAKRKQKDTGAPPPRQAILGNISNARDDSDVRDSVIAKRKGTAESTKDPIAKISRGERDSTTPALTDVLVKSKAFGEAGGKGANKPKTKNTRKKGARKDGQIVAKSTKSTKRSMPLKSPFFVRPDATEVPSKPVTYEKPALVPKSPNKLVTEPPITPAHTQWTPAKGIVISIDCSPAPADLEASEAKDTKDRGTLDFANMVSEMKFSKSYSRDGSSVPSLGGLDKSGNGLIRKRAIEMVNLPSNSASASGEPKAPERKQPRKKPKTITGQATAQYREAKAAASHSLLDYFALEDANAESAAAEKPTRKRKATSEKKRDSVPAPILLSPEAAKRQFDETECIFGTSSQLEVMAEIEIVDKPEPAEDENAPDYMPPSTSIVRRSFLKTLTKDRKGGNKLVGTRRGTNIDLLDGSMVEDFEAHPEGFPAEQPKLPESRLGRGTASKLWDAAARDLDGGLLSVEVVDMSLGNDILSLPTSPKPVEEILTTRSLDLSECLALPEDVGTVEDEPVPNLRVEGQSMRSPLRTVVHGEDIPNLRIEGQPANAPQNNGAQEEFIPNLRIEDIPAPVRVTRFAIPDTDEAKLWDHASSIIPRGVTASGTGAPASVASTLANSSAVACLRMQSEPSMPDYNAWITTKLKAEVAKYGFKDLKTRPRMVSVLEQCWLAKNKRNIEQEANKGTGVAASNTLTQRIRSASPSVASRAQSDGPNNPSYRGYSTTAAPGVSKFRENGPTIRRVSSEKRGQRPPARGRSPTPRDQPTTNQPTAKQPGINEAPGPAGQCPRFIILKNSQSPYKPVPSTSSQSPKRKTRKRKRKQNPPSPSLLKSLSKSVSPSRSRSRSGSPRSLCEMISRLVLGTKSGSEGCKFLHAILMYDPISVEELAEWLNTRGIMEGGFGAHAVTTTDVKNWCISKGVCCFSEASWRVKRKK